MPDRRFVALVACLAVAVPLLASGAPRAFPAQRISSVRAFRVAALAPVTVASLPPAGAADAPGRPQGGDGARRVGRGEPAADAGESAMPQSLPVPLGARVQTAPPSDPTASAGTPAPAIGASFQALGDNITVIPPDTHGAVGPNHVMTALNSQVRIQTRAGVAVSTVSLSSFWAGTGSSYTDPRVLYDPYGARWISVIAADFATASSKVGIAVSATSDPTGTWHRFAHVADPTGASWCDYPTLGFNKDWIVVQCNMFPVSSGGFYSSVVAFRKNVLYGGTADTPTVTKLTGFGGTQHPTVTYDASTPAMHLIQSWNGGAGAIRIWSLDGSGAAIAGPVVTLAGTSWSSSPGGNGNLAPQQGTSSLIHVGDDRMLSAVYRNGSIWAAQTAFVAGATRSVAQWWQVSPSGSVQQFGRIDGGAGGRHYAFPSISVNADNDVLVGYSRFSTSEFASAGFAFRYGTDPAGAVGADTLLKAGEDTYFKTYGEASGRNRWGDYSNTVVDPLNDRDFWTIQEYAWSALASSACTPHPRCDRWATWWGQVRLDTGTPEISLAPGSLSFGSQTVGTTSAAQTVTVKNTGDAALHVSAASIAGTHAADFAKSSDTCTGAAVAPSGTCAVQLRFAPSATGARTASLSVASDAAGSPHAVTLSGTGVQAALSAAPGSLSFSGQTTGTTSNAQTITVTNVGTATLNVGTVTIGGADAAHFQKSSDLCSGKAVAASSTCAIQVRFAPAAAGARAASVSIPSNAPGSPHAVPVSGTGLTPAALSAAPASFAFGSRAAGTQSSALTVTITNTGGSPAAISSVAVGGAHAGDFPLTGNGCGGTSLSAGAQCSVQVAFAPTAAGARAATLTVTAPGTSAATSLSGTGLAPAVSTDPAAVAFGVARPGSAVAPRPVVVTNSGNASLSGIAPSIEGTNAGDFSVVSSTCAASVAPGASCTIGVGFTPGAAGARAASLAIASNAPGSPHRVSLSGSGDAAPPVSSFTTAHNAILIGGVSPIEGGTTDDLAGVDLTGVTMTLTWLTGGTESRALTPLCDAPQRSCTWSSTAPLLPGIYSVSVRARDRAGNAETPGPTITVLVI